MPKRFRQTRRLNMALTEDGYRRLRGLAAEAGLSEDEALCFLLENLDGVIDEERFAHRLRRFADELPTRRE